MFGHPPIDKKQALRGTGKWIWRRILELTLASAIIALFFIWYPPFMIFAFGMAFVWGGAINLVSYLPLNIALSLYNIHRQTKMRNPDLSALALVIGYSFLWLLNLAVNSSELEGASILMAVGFVPGLIGIYWADDIMKPKKQKLRAKVLKRRAERKSRGVWQAEINSVPSHPKRLTA